MSGLIDLTGISVLVTRPKRQAESLCRLIEVYGGTVIRCPTVLIESIESSETLAQALTAVATTDIVIFTSPNAAEHGLNALRQARLALPSGVPVLAMGPGTAAKLQENGIITTAISKAPFNSEALIELDVLVAPAGQSVVIFCGDGGREWLSKRLKEKGAGVIRVICYRRSAPPTADSSVITYWQDHGIDVLTLTSIAAAENLWILLKDRPKRWLRDVAVVTVSERIETACRSLGYEGKIAIADHAGHDALLQAIHTHVDMINSR